MRYADHDKIIKKIFQSQIEKSEAFIEEKSNDTNEDNFDKSFLKKMKLNSKALSRLRQGSHNFSIVRSILLDYNSTG